LNILRKIVERVARTWCLFRLRRTKGVSLGDGLIVYGHPLVSLAESGRLKIGRGVILCSDTRHTALALNHPIKLATVRPGASIEIGDETGVSGGTFVAAKSIRIGREVLLGANVTIVDNDFHPTAAAGRRHSDDWSKIGVEEVSIGDNVFIGLDCIILKGTVIGAGSVVAAGSVVRGKFGERVILAGNPAKVVGEVPAA
jgi:acetyltransferase-like isoleucine patch superfamily enzyme